MNRKYKKEIQEEFDQSFREVALPAFDDLYKKINRNEKRISKIESRSFN